METLHGKFEPDWAFEEAVTAWIAYHQAADRVDGHIIPGSSEQRKLVGLAVREGLSAMRRALPGASLNGHPEYDSKRRNQAKIEALRRVKRTQS